jgi:hypothetical protein
MQFLNLKNLEDKAKLSSEMIQLLRSNYPFGHFNNLLT